MYHAHFHVKNCIVNVLILRFVVLSTEMRTGYSQGLVIPKASVILPCGWWNSRNMKFPPIYLKDFRHSHSLVKDLTLFYRRVKSIVQKHLHTLSIKPLVRAFSHQYVHHSILVGKFLCVHKNKSTAHHRSRI